jgi:nucleoside phosphorylase
VTAVDILIITALPEELDAARDAGRAAAPGGPGVMTWQERDAYGHTPYEVGDYVTADGRRLSIALARPTRMGGRETGPLATTLTDLLAPTCLAMSGVCAGNPDDTAPGDVVVAEVAYEYDEGKLTGTTFQGDHRQYPLNTRWLRAAQDLIPDGLPSYAAAGDAEARVWFLERLYLGQDPRTHPARPRYFPRGTWQPRLQRFETDGLIRRHEVGWALTDPGKALIRGILDDDVDGPDRLPFAVHTGPIASGSAVMKDRTVWHRLKTMGVRTVMGLEMEAATVATVAHDRNVPHWLVAKGVMDSADLNKDDRYKRFAARASAEVLYRLLERLMPPAPRPPDATSAPTRKVPGPVKLDVTRRLSYDWQDLADYLGVPAFATRRFRHGDEPRDLWEWIEARGRLAELPQALDVIGRGDLAALVRAELQAGAPR